MGCGLKFDAKEIKFHEKKCKFGTVNCVDLRCKTMVKLNDMKTHLVDKHNVKISNKIPGKPLWFNINNFNSTTNENPKKENHSNEDQKGKKGQSQNMYSN